MKDHQNQTPLKLSLSARSADTRHGKFKGLSSKKSIKTAAKNLNAAFASVSEDSVDSSPISEIPYLNHNDDTKTILEEEPSSMTLLPSDKPPFEITDDVTGSGLTIIYDCELDGFKFNPKRHNHLVLLVDISS